MSCMPRSLDMANDSVTMDLFEENMTVTFPPRMKSEAQDLYEGIKYYVNTVILPIVFSFGITGNALNIAVFTQKRLRHGLDKIELSATVGLLALSVSDLLFCIAGFPAVFLHKYEGPRATEPGVVIASYYFVYKRALMNLFLFTSTWLIVLVAVERYIAVCHPFKARCIIKIRRTIMAQVGVFIFSFLLNLPLFLVYKVECVPSDEECLCLVNKPWIMRHNKTFAHVHRVIWSTLGTFIPLILLIVCNVRILFEVYKSSQRGIADTESRSSSRITLILVTMIILFVVLVCPSMILEFASGFIDFRHKSDTFMHNFSITVVLMNVTQAIKFSCNFLLYCSINKKFRETIARLNCLRGSGKSTCGDTSTNKYQLVEVTTQKTNVTNIKSESCAL